MKPLTLVLSVVAWLSFVGCGAPQHDLGRVRHVSLVPDKYPPTQLVQVVNGKPTKPHTVIARLAFRGSPDEEPLALGSFMEKAKQIGADAVAMDNEERTHGSFAADRRVWNASAIKWE